MEQRHAVLHRSVVCFWRSLIEAPPLGFAVPGIERFVLWVHSVSKESDKASHDPVLKRPSNERLLKYCRSI